MAIQAVRGMKDVMTPEVDKWQKIELGITAVGNDRRHIDSSLNSVLNFLDSLYLAPIMDTKIEIINL